MSLTWIAPASAATYYLWQQDFTSDTTDWQGPVTHNATEGTATAGQGAFSRFGEYRSTFPGDYVAELDVYLDPSWTLGQGFEYTVASSNSSGAHLRDFVFHIASTATGLRVIGDNNVYGAGATPSSPRPGRRSRPRAGTRCSTPSATQVECWRST